MQQFTRQHRAALGLCPGHKARGDIVGEKPEVGEEAAAGDRRMPEAALTRDETTTISEDDVIFHSQFEKVAPEVMATLPAEWDLGLEF